MIRNTFLEALIGFFLASFVHGHPSYGSYDYDGHGHRGYNKIGTVNKAVDYYSKPQYAFGYEVDDYYSQLSHGRWEVRDGDVTQGQYRVLLPDGRIQIVSYIADLDGYRPTIQYIGKGVHPPPPPTYAHIKTPKHIPDPYILSSPPIRKDIHPTPAPFYPIADTPSHYEPGPLKLHVDPLAINHIDGHSGVGYGGSRPSSDLLFYGPSSKREVKLTPSKISRRRAQLYGRTLFRRDIPKPGTKPR